MALFAYRAVDEEGRISSGSLDATNAIDLELRLRRLGLDLITFESVKRSAAARSRRVTRPELITFQPPPSTGQDRYWKESGEMLIAYSLNGAEVREDIGTTVTFHRTVLPGMGPGDERIFIDGISSLPHEITL